MQARPKLLGSAFRKICERMREYARRNFVVLVYGPTGCGKELALRAYQDTWQQTHKGRCQVVNSAGKHTNTMLIFLRWMQVNMKSFIEKRTNSVTQADKLRFYQALEEIAKSDDRQLDRLQLSDVSANRLGVAMDNEDKKLLADLILIGINKNSQLVRSVAANYRKFVPKLASARSADPTPVEPTEDRA